MDAARADGEDTGDAAAGTRGSLVPRLSDPAARRGSPRSLGRRVVSVLTEKYRVVAGLRDSRRSSIGELAQEEECEWAEQLDDLWRDMTDEERCEVDPGWPDVIARARVWKGAE